MIESESCNVTRKKKELHCVVSLHRQRKNDGAHNMYGKGKRNKSALFRLSCPGVACARRECRADVGKLQHIHREGPNKRKPTLTRGNRSHIKTVS